MRRHFYSFVSISVAVLFAASANAQVISVAFAGDNGGGGANFPVPTDFAGVVAVSNWNADDSQLATGSLSGLMDDSGAGTTAGVTWGGSANVWGGLAGTPGTTTGDERMVNGWLDDNGTGADIQVTGIPYAFYDVYVYGSTDGVGNAGNGWTTNVNGTDFYSAGEFTTIGLDNTFFSSTVGHVDASGGSPNPSFFRISSLSGPDLSIFGLRDSNGPTLPGGGTTYRGSVSGFQIVEITNPAPNVEINRDTGEINIVNPGTSPYTLSGYSLLSSAGALVEGNWISVAGNYDSAGDGSVSGDAWNIFRANDMELAEGTFGSGSVATGVSVNLGAAWRKFYREEVGFELLDSAGNVIAANVTFVGNGGEAWSAGDFNFDGAVDALDWPVVRDGFNSDLAGLDEVDAYYMGDLTGDNAVGIEDLLEFEALFDAENGAGAFARMVPEPGSVILLAFGGLTLFGCRRQRRSSLVAFALIAAAGLSVSPDATTEAQVISVSFAGDNGGGAANFIGPADVAGFVPVANWNGDETQLATGALSGLVDDSGAATGVGVTWSGSDNTWGGTPNGGIDSNENMMNGWLDDNGTGADIQVTGIPYAIYDVYVYGSSDGGNEGRGFTTRVNGTDYFSGGEFTNISPGGSFFDSSIGFVDAASTMPDPSYFRISGVTGSSLSIFSGRNGAGPALPGGSTDYRGGVAGFQIVENLDPNPDFLTLEVDLASGSVSLLNNGSTDQDIDFYQVTSSGGSLNLAGWNSLEDQDYEGNGAPGNGNGWEELGNLDSTIAAEFYLQGSSVLVGGATNIDLGNMFTVGSAQDLAFTYEIEGFGSQTGVVNYIATPGINGDFNGDGAWDCVDIDALVGEIAADTNNTAFDMNGDGVVDNDDVYADGNGWLAVGGANNPSDTSGGNPFLPGDANLDGVVDVSDFNLWNGSKFTNTAAWCSGDFNTDGGVDVSDFNLWNGNKFTAADTRAVPEPGSSALLVPGLGLVCLRKRRKQFSNRRDANTIRR